MRRHMLIYHVGVPLAVLAVGLLVGAPFGTALSVAIAAGCVSMVVMMVAGGHRHGHAHHVSATAQPRGSAADTSTSARTRR